jgi:protocatechuate 3,4-dioxygenase beta subunit
MWITGQVVDDLGRSLDGVTIEVSGPPGIGKRAAVSNAKGQYVMQDLRPGAYTITFAHPGFSTLQRTTDQLSTFVATINVRLQATSLAAASD